MKIKLVKKINNYSKWYYNVNEYYEILYDDVLKMYVVADNDGVFRLCMNGSDLIKHFDEKTCTQFMREKKLERILK